MSTKSILRNVFPAFVVMALGLGGAFFVYDVTNNSDSADAIASIEPAAGSEVSTDTDAILQIDYVNTDGSATEEIANEFTEAVSTAAELAEGVVSETVVGVTMDEDTSAAEALQNIAPAAGHEHAEDAHEHVSEEAAETAVEAAEEAVEEAVKDTAEGHAKDMMKKAH